MSEVLINDVSDTALWVATYRARESQRPDALFQDRFAQILAGERGEHIANKMSASRYTNWSVVIRTCIIDSYITEQISTGVDTIVNLGAGLDSRPYRMKLPANLNWIEADYPHMIQFKMTKLQNETPVCHLERFGVDLANAQARQDFLKKISARSKNILVLTEGVVPYLTNEQAAELAEDLRQHPEFRYWIVDYFAPRVLKYMQSGKRREQMKNAPFQFSPANWFQFFASHGWKEKQIRYTMEESVKLGRKPPTPWWGWIFGLWLSKEKVQRYKQMTGYVLLEPK